MRELCISNQILLCGAKCVHALHHLQCCTKNSHVNTSAVSRTNTSIPSFYPHFTLTQTHLPSFHPPLPQIINMCDEYPRTQHLSFSPQVAEDDVVRSLGAEDPLIGPEVIITEKADGGNCCLSKGMVFARTHGQEATHDSFKWVKGFYSQFSYSELLDGLSLFGENLQGVHSIEYSGLQSFFYLFAVQRDCGEWMAWDDMCALVAAIEEATSIAIPIVPEVHRGTFTNMAEVEKLMKAEAQKPSSLGGLREGFVMRVASAIPNADFPRKVAKYVRRGHIQTSSDWKRTWKQAKLVVPEE